MNSESGSALQKASFFLLVFIAGALAYLIVRDRIRDRQEAAALASAQSQSDTMPAGGASAAENPREGQTSFAPLRPRPATNAARVVVGKAVVSPVNTTSTLGRPGDSAGTSLLADSVEPVPAATTPSTIAPGGGFTRGKETAITGRVTLNGAPPAEKRVTLDPMCNQLHPAPMFTRHFVTGRDSGLANVFVYVKGGAPKDESQQPSMPVLDNIACEFQPYILGVRAGQPFEIRNSDTLLHNAHLTPKPGGENREANLALPVRGLSVRRTLPSPEVFVRVKCDVHPWMFAYIGVMEHRWFAVTDNNGNFTLPPGLPPGEYTIAAVHLKAGESLQPLFISEGQRLDIRFTLDVPPALAQATPQ